MNGLSAANHVGPTRLHTVVKNS